MIFPELINIKKNLKNALLYFGSSIIQLLIGIFTTPIFAKYLSESDFAIMGYYGSISSFFLPLFTLCFNYFYLMRYFKQTEIENKNTLSNILIFISLSNTIIIIFSYIIIYIYFYFLKVTIPFYPFAFIILISLFFDVYRTFILIDFRMKKKAGKYFFISLIYIILNFSIGLLFVVRFNGGAEGRLWGTFLAQFGIAVIVILYLLKRKINFRVNFREIKNAFKFSWPVILGSYAYFPIMNMDKLFLERIDNIKEFGLYNIGVTFGTYLLIMSTALYQAFEPDWFKFVATNNKKKFLQHSFVFLLITSVAIILFLLTSKELVYFLTAGRYEEAYIYANINAISVFFLAISMILNVIILAKQKTNYMLYINIIIGILSIAIYKYCISIWIFQGANYARIIIYIALIFTQIIFIIYSMNKKMNFNEIRRHES